MPTRLIIIFLKSWTMVWCPLTGNNWSHFLQRNCNSPVQPKTTCNYDFYNPVATRRTRLLVSTTKEIKDIIKSLPLKNSSSYDEIPLRILKISMPLIASPLTYLCNKSITTGSFPTRLKYSQIIQIFKKVNKQN